MRKNELLEKALSHIINGEEADASKFMREYVLETARSIHQQLREGSESTFEAIDDSSLDDEYFTTDDLVDVKDEDDAVSAEDAVDTLAADEVSAEDETVEAVASEVEELEGRVEDIEDQIERLTAEFEAELAKVEADDFSDETSDESSDADAEAEAEAEAVQDDMSSDDSDDVSNGEVSSEDEDDFDKIAEGVLDDLKKVDVKNDDGKLSDGSSVAQNKVSPVASGKEKAAPIKAKPSTEKEADTKVEKLVKADKLKPVK